MCPAGSMARQEQSVGDGRACRAGRVRGRRWRRPVSLRTPAATQGLLKGPRAPGRWSGRSPRVIAVQERLQWWGRRIIASRPWAHQAFLWPPCRRYQRACPEASHALHAGRSRIPSRLCAEANEQPHKPSERALKRLSQSCFESKLALSKNDSSTPLLTPHTFQRRLNLPLKTSVSL